jgi:hypothetical protein
MQDRAHFPGGAKASCLPTIQSSSVNRFQRCVVVERIEQRWVTRLPVAVARFPAHCDPCNLAIRPEHPCPTS